ncbi:MAG: hypothetical protein FD124_1923 [Alphaproteobacteria bacterium]|nr:MAG: hypothetical protein FD160_688 [Caulobacteraceae bacterium]TPW05955.1 MAG: hypothetical protein FD124_1923 [Alphaproteobacteria bacterium]
MQILNPLHHHRASIEAFAQSLKLWLLELALWLVALTESRTGRIQLQHLIIEARQDIRVLIALKMGLRLRIHTGRRLASGHGYRSAPPGFAVQTRTGRRLRLFTRSIALKNLRDMQRALTDLDGVVTRALARLPVRITRTSIVMVVAVTDQLGVTALAPATEGADTS